MNQQSEAINNEDYEKLVKNHFKLGKWLYNWRTLFFNHCFTQQKQIEQQQFEENSQNVKLMFNTSIEFTIKENQKIIVGSLPALQQYRICGDNINRNLCKFHFTFTNCPNMFGLAWVKCLNSRIGTREIKRIIARFVRFESKIEMVDVSDRNYQSYIQTLKNEKITTQLQTYCLDGEYQQFFQISLLTNQKLQNLTPQFHMLEKIFILGTHHDILINQQLILLLNGPEKKNDINRINKYLTNLMSELKKIYNDAILIKTNNSFLQILLFSVNSDYNLEVYDLEYKLQLEKFEKILQIIRYENGSWSIQDEMLNKEIKKNQKYFLQKRQKIITAAPNYVEQFEIQID